MDPDRSLPGLSQIRLLVDAFDKNGDGMVSMQEFLEFVGEDRGPMGGDKQLALQRKCVWRTNCNKVRAVPW
jgi:glutathione synthase/RimK-type ligase-like ATP-grasp enzyme